MEIVFQETDYAVGVHQVHGGSGDPSPFTAYGVLQAIRASLKRRFDDEDVGRYSYAVQGVGHVGLHLVRLLREEDAKVFVCDVDEEAVRQAVELGCEAVGVDDVYDVEADVFSPTALGATLNAETIPRLKCSIVAGAANNQLAEPRHGAALKARGVLYAPDYLVNAGGLIDIHVGEAGGDEKAVLERTARIYATALEVFERAAEEDAPTGVVADRMAEERFRSKEKRRAAA